MAKHIKLFIGSAINIFTGVAGYLLWTLYAQDTVRMARDLKETAGIVLLVSFIPALIFFVMWYFGCVKSNAQVGKKRPSRWPYFFLGVITTWAIPLVCSIAFFDKAIIWAAAAAGFATIGSLISYLIGEPR